MKTEYRKIYNKNYVILSECNISDYQECYRSKMLKSNKLNNFLSYDTQSIDGKIRFSYDISSKQSLFHFYENMLMDYETIRHIILSLKSAFDILNNYLLEPDYIILDPNLIYINLATKEIYFCYCPGHKCSFYESLSDFLCYILSKIDHNDNNSIILAYSLQQQSIQDNYTFDDLMQIINKPIFKHEANNITEYVEPNEPATPLIPTTSDTLNFDSLDLTASTLPISQHKSKPNLLVIPSVFSCLSIALLGYGCFIENLFSTTIFGFLSIICMGIIFGFYKYSTIKTVLSDQTIHEESNHLHKLPEVSDIPSKAPQMELQTENNFYEDTVILGYRKTENTPQLIYTGTDFHSEVFLTSFPFVIGKMSENVTMVIDNPMISRIHARIFFKENHYYIEDMNSSNGTYINDTLIQPHTLTEINIGDNITFAHLTYIFQ